MASIMVIVVVVAVALAALFAAGRRKAQNRGNDIWPRMPLGKNEQLMYFRLAEALPDHMILAQVAFSSLLKTRSRTTRDSFDRKVAGFVVCTKAFIVVAIVELDDTGHPGREAADSQRDAILRQADFPVLRYRSIPGIEPLRADIANLAQRTPTIVTKNPAAPPLSPRTEAQP